jgi:hypothetical protein
VAYVEVGKSRVGGSKCPSGNSLGSFTLRFWFGFGFGFVLGLGLGLPEL